MDSEGDHMTTQAGTMRIAITSDEGKRLVQFLEDRERARVKVISLQAQAAAFTAEGKTVPAAALTRRARVIQYLWCLTPCNDVNDEQNGAFNGTMGEGR